MKRGEVINKLKKQAKKNGVSFEQFELSNHTGFNVGGKRSTLGRHSEINDMTARKFWDQFEDVFGKEWWR